jgi:hypothetical protein
VLLFATCFDAATGRAGPSARAAACNARDGNAVLVLLVAVVVLGLGAVVLSVRRGARGPGVWLLAALPALGVLLVPVLIGLLPPG